MDYWTEYRRKMRELAAALEANAHYLRELADALTDVSTACHEVSESVNHTIDSTCNDVRAIADCN